MTQQDPDNIAWVDFESTGLLTTPGMVVLEAAVIITDGDLNELASLGPIPLKATETELDVMIPFVRDMHTKTGLIERVREATVSREEFDEMFAGFVAPFFPAKKSVLPDGTKYRGMVIGGNSVKFDFGVIEQFFPKTIANMDYRVIDISSLGELQRRWNRAAWDAMPAKASDHTAMTDIREGIKELRYYREAGLTASAA